MTLDALVLRALHASEIPLPPGELASACGANRADLDAALHRLREAGFDVEAHPSRGIRLLASPDRLIADDVAARLREENPLSTRILVYEETSSTNDIVSRLGREGHPAGLAVFAERQTAGRGRFGRKWESESRSGLWFSLLLRPEWPISSWPRLTTWAGVCVASAVEKTCGLPTRIKWPNDVLIQGRKIAGILIETATGPGDIPFAVVGIGINVNQSHFPPELAEKASSLKLLTGKPIDRPALATSVLAELASRLSEAPRGDSLIAEARTRSAILGKWTRLSAGTTIVEGHAEDLDAEGNLLLRQSDGTLYRATAGEVTSQM